MTLPGARVTLEKTLVRPFKPGVCLRHRDEIFSCDCWWQDRRSPLDRECTWVTTESSDLTFTQSSDPLAANGMRGRFRFRYDLGQQLKFSS